MNAHRKRRVILFLILCFVLAFLMVSGSSVKTDPLTDNRPIKITSDTALAADILNKIEVKNLASENNYSRNNFGSDWASVGGCDTRNIILNRDLVDTVVNDKCEVMSGKLADPYTGKIINFIRGVNTSGDIQIDHAVALSNAWRTGAQQFSPEKRIAMANDSLELLAVDGKANMEKSDGDASVWLPPNKPFRCQYVARQIAVKQKYSLWVTSSEKNAIAGILSKCPSQMLPSP